MQYYVIIEISSSSAKVLLYNLATGEQQIAQEPLPYTVNDGRSHDTQGVYKIALGLAKTIIRKEKERWKTDRVHIDTIVIVTTWHSLAVMTRNGEPLTRTWLWSGLLDESLEHEKIQPIQAYERTGCHATMIYPVNKWLYLTQEGRELAAIASSNQIWLGDQASYVYYQLTGYFETSSTMASGSGFYNLIEEDYDKDIQRTAGIKREQLPTVRDGYRLILPDIAEDLGISQTAKVYTPVSDGGMNQYYYGNDANGIISASIGTSGALRCYVNQPMLSEKHLWCYRLGKGYILGAAIAGAGNLLNSYREKLFPEIELKDLEQAIRTTMRKPRSPYLFMPFELGERNPGFRQDHSYGFFDSNGRKIPREMYEVMPLEGRLELAIALLEGILFNLYQCYRYLLKADIPVKKIRLSGGILRSNIWVQMFADVFQEDVYKDDQIHASVFGGLYYGLRMNGLEVPSNDEGEVVTPDISIETQAYYKKKYEQYLSQYQEKV